MIKAATAITAVLVITAAILGKTFLIGYYQIPQNGMFPGLPAGSVLFANKWAYRQASDVHRGDVVVFVREQSDGKYVYIWRVIGVPGDRVVASGAELSVNGRLCPRDGERTEGNIRIHRETLGGATYEIAFGPVPAQLPPNVDVDVVVPADHLFVMGDNRFAAVDSRYFGPIAFRSIIAKKF